MVTTMIRFLVGVTMVLIGIVASVTADSFTNQACNPTYCINRNSYCSVGCCRCICNYNHRYNSGLDACELSTSVVLQTNNPHTKLETSTSTPVNQVIILSSATSETAKPTPKKSGTQNAGLIAGAIVGVIIFLVVLLVMVILCYRKKSQKSNKSAPNQNNVMASEIKCSYRDRDQINEYDDVITNIASDSEPQNGRPHPANKQSNLVTNVGASHLSGEIGSSLPPRRPLPALSHSRDDDDTSNDDLYEQLDDGEGQNEKAEHPYVELTYAHSPGAYEALEPTENPTQSRI